MALPEICPDAKRLDAWLSGSLPDAERESLVAHLDACVSCREIERLAPGMHRGFRGRAPGRGGLTPGAGDAGGLSRSRPSGRLGSEGRAAGTGANQTTEHAPAARLRRSIPRARGDSPARSAHIRSDRAGSAGAGMGEVFQAIDPTLNRVVAIKVLAPRWPTSATARRRFLREARAAAAVCHEHVVTIHAVDESDGLPYLVMQFVAGKSLQERIDRDRAARA